MLCSLIRFTFWWIDRSHVERLNNLLLINPLIIYLETNSIIRCKIKETVGITSLACRIVVLMPVRWRDQNSIEIKRPHKSNPFGSDSTTRSTHECVHFLWTHQTSHLMVYDTMPRCKFSYNNFYCISYVRHQVFSIYTESFWKILHISIYKLFLKSHLILLLFLVNWLRQYSVVNSSWIVSYNLQRNIKL